MYAGDWARKGVRISLVKTGNDTSCSRYVTLEMVDEDRYARNPYAESIAIIANFPPAPALVVPYESGKLVYNITLQLPQLPCDASPSCVDYIDNICQQQGVGFYYQMRMTQESGDGTCQECALSRSPVGLYLAACCDSRRQLQTFEIACAKPWCPPVFHTLLSPLVHAVSTGCQGGNEFLGIRDGESFNAATWNFEPVSRVLRQLNHTSA